MTGTASDLRQAAIRILVRDRLDRSAFQSVFEQLNDAIDRDEPLRTLILAEPIGPAACHALADALRSTFYTSLTRVCIWRAAIADAGFIAFCATLPNLHRLRALDLIDCELVDIGACCRALSAAVLARNAPTLTRLALDYNPIGDDGLRLLQTALRRAASAGLTTLSLSYCDLGPGSGSPLGALTSAPRSALARLNLEGNRLGDLGLDQLSPGLAQSMAVADLNLRANRIAAPFDGLRRFCSDAVPRCRSLRTVDLDGNALDDGAVEVVLDAVRAGAHIVEMRIPKTTTPALFEAVHLALQKNAADSRRRHRPGPARPTSGRAASAKSQEVRRRRVIEEFLRSQQERRRSHVAMRS